MKKKTVTLKLFKGLTQFYNWAKEKRPLITAETLDASVEPVWLAPNTPSVCVCVKIHYSNNKVVRQDHNEVSVDLKLPSPHIWKLAVLCVA